MGHFLLQIYHIILSLSISLSNLFIFMFVIIYRNTNGQTDCWHNHHMLAVTMKLKNFCDNLMT